MSGASASRAPADRHGPPEAARSRSWYRLPLLAAGGVALVAGTAAGLHRLGLGGPEALASLAALHGPLMVSGFFGAVIGFERAVATGRIWAYLGPLAAGIGTALAVVGAPLPAIHAAWIVAGLVLAVASTGIALRQPALFTGALACGAIAWPAGVLAWAAGAPMAGAALWWIAFLVLTIAAERLELSRLLRLETSSKVAFGVCIALLAAAAGLGTVGAAGAWPVAGVALLALTAWLFNHDVARRTIRISGLPRYAALCLLSGYVWLGAGGLLMVALPIDTDPLVYDAALHSVFLGFAVAMVFGHAPIILPAVARLPVAFDGGFYGPLVLLHVSVGLRVGADLAGAFDTRAHAGLLTAIAFVLFIAVVARGARRGLKARRGVHPPHGPASRGHCVV
ncbi:MAG TPA: hypothetical protein VF342_09345 [Alphaproteobacteria bacterium]